jgi:hypothetical protein
LTGGVDTAGAGADGTGTDGAWTVGTGTGVLGTGGAWTVGVGTGSPASATAGAAAIATITTPRRTGPRMTSHEADTGCIGAANDAGG